MNQHKIRGRLRKLPFLTILLYLTSLLVMLGYLIPIKVHIQYAGDRKLYEYDSISKKDFRVYTTSFFGKEDVIESFQINKNKVDHSGYVLVKTNSRFGDKLFDLPFIRVKNSGIHYNKICYEDRIDQYQPEVSETITYIDGRTETIYYENSEVHVEINSIEKSLLINLEGKNNSYMEEFPMTTIVSLTTNTKVPTDSDLSHDDLKININYSDGSSTKADNDEIYSNEIKDPKKGNNKLTCYYNDENHVINVKAFIPALKESFGSYGTFTLDYSKPYKVAGARRLNTSNGRIYFNNHYETYYSQRILTGTALYIPGRHVAKDGTVRDKDGYICVASDYGFKGRHEVVLTSLGPAKVYDCGCPYGTIDLYVDW